MLLAMGTLLRMLDWLLYIPSCLVWALMLCPRDQPQVYKKKNSEF
jgi:uncharacterized protein YaeQ